MEEVDNIETESILKNDEEPSLNQEVEVQEIPVTVEEVEEVEIKEAPKPKAKAKGHRKPKDGVKAMELTEKTKCKDCNKTMSQHTLNYKHKCPKKKLIIEPIVETKKEDEKVKVEVKEPEPVELNSSDEEKILKTNITRYNEIKFKKEQQRKKELYDKIFNF